MARERGGLDNGTMTLGSCRETCIRGGRPVRDVVAKSGMAPAGGVPVVPMLTTGADAAAFVRAYLMRVRQVDRAIDRQLRHSSPRVGLLEYAYGSPSGMPANVMSWLGGLAPRFVGNLTAVASIALWGSHFDERRRPRPLVQSPCRDSNY